MSQKRALNHSIIGENLDTIVVSKGSLRGHADAMDGPVFIPRA
jgi:hypothetical protein